MRTINDVLEMHIVLSLWYTQSFIENNDKKVYTVKLGNKEGFDKEPICHLIHKDRELLALRNNFRATKKFLIAKFDCTTQNVIDGQHCTL